MYYSDTMYTLYLLGPVKPSMQSHVSVESLVVFEHAAALWTFYWLGRPGRDGGRAVINAMVL